uniref:J domain-containing protein n=1 Tax=Eutreptiella gymnastica TaxID=73025 RepID=A0A7S1NPE4_9EUGL|mmetsp:Transcript_66850/g.118628  ORF Transcript_66850/g.118628 Transcript_66850/m.118628 type:complete len:289 (+) Transcript_66850:54-920(+)
MGDGSEEIQRILRAKNFYDILGVPKNVDDDDLKRKYKRLALACHPDKSTHPKAEEAFKAVGKAFGTLSDPQKRAQYDRFGEEGVQEGMRHRHHGGAHGAEMYPEDIYDIFAQMFGADVREMHGRRQQAWARAQRRQNAGQTAAEQQLQNRMQLLQVLPILLFFLLYFLFSFGANERRSVFSLHMDQEQGYTHKRKTKVHNIPYYVQPNFRREYSGHDGILSQVEQQVYASYKGHLNRRCKFEQREKIQMQQRAGFYSGSEKQKMLDKAARHSTASCDDLQDLINKFGY